ncbi:PadR family transcriptional regulator [Kutzneria kofuensis]|uniref:PadR family transcriptional regulator n=1 Tax=Kutzneria kofuensis TaxID=103725 RepID=UPI0031F02C1B
MTYVWVEIVMLANLARQPAHGYELRQRVEQNLGTTLSNNSLYPTLRRFTEAGAVTRTPQAQRGRPTRHVYEITDVGVEMLHDMLAELPDDLAADQAEFMSRLAHFDRLTIAERLAVLDARTRALLARAARTDELVTTVEPDSWARIVLDEVLSRSHAELRWLETLRVRAAEPPLED